MKALRAALVAAAAFAALPATAQDFDLSKIKCKDFVSSGKESIGSILIWLEGHYTKGSSAPVISTSRITKDGKALGEYCGKNGEDDVIKAANAVMKEQ